MICSGIQQSFRLLDGNVGWDPDGDYPNQVSGLYDQYGLRLQDHPDLMLDAKLLTPYMSPAWLARGSRIGEWFLCGANPVANQCDTIWRRDPCYDSWIDISHQLSTDEPLNAPLAIAVAQNRLAVVNQPDPDGAHEIRIWSMPHGRLAGFITLDPSHDSLGAGWNGWLDEPMHVTAIAWAPWKELVVAARSVFQPPSKSVLLRFDPAGRPLGILPLGHDQSVRPNQISRLQVGREGSLWVAVGYEPGPFHLWEIRPAAAHLDRQKRADRSKFIDLDFSTSLCDPDERFTIQRWTGEIDVFHNAEKFLDQWLRKTKLLWASATSFCIDEPTSTGRCVTRCYDRCARLSNEAEPNDDLTGKLFVGELRTEPIDSFIPRCRWHRFQMDAEIPAGTTVTVQVATIESVDDPVNPLDWSPPIENASDWLIDQPPGRYLVAKIELTGREFELTPVIHRVRLDFPRQTSLDQLPAIYRQDPEAEDFTERFLAIFDASTEELDLAIKRFPALLDPAGVPPEVLPWIGKFLGIVFDPAWSTKQRRTLLSAAPDLYRKRGTLAGLRLAIELLFGQQPAITEQVFQRAWGALSQSTQLGNVRLFGKSRSRFRIGSSPLGEVPLQSFGDPEHDPVRADAHRFSVQMPPCPQLHRLGIGHLERLIESQKPAHTLHTLRIGGQGFVIGRRSSIGIDTQLVPTDSPVLGGAQHEQENKGNVYLSRSSILRKGPSCKTCAFQIGIKSAIGIHTLLE